MSVTIPGQGIIAYPLSSTAFLFLFLAFSIACGGSAMKVHPVCKKRNSALRFDDGSRLSESSGVACRQKKLRRLPHIFDRVLEVPLPSDADVSVQETPDAFRFAAPADAEGLDVRAETIEIYPGITKVVIRGFDLLDSPWDEAELDGWRFRLPASTRPELATAICVDGELVVTVPKGAPMNSSSGDGEDEV